MLIAEFSHKGEEIEIENELWQYDYGQRLQIKGLDLPETFEVHFAWKDSEKAKVVIGSTIAGISTVDIPNIALEQRKTITAYIYLSDTTEGETVNTIVLSVNKRKAPENFEAPEDVDLFHHTLAATAEYQRQAKESEEQAATQAADAEAWAHGREGHPEQARDNAKYYAEQAAKMVSKIDNAEAAIKQAGQKQIQAIADSLDNTLTAEGKAADAKAVGENFAKVNKITDSLKERAKAVGDKLEDIRKQIADIQYIPIEILSFVNNISIAELGSTANEISLTWKLNKIPKSATLNNISISGELKADQSVTIRDAALTTDSIFTLAVTDEKNKTVQKKSSIAFYNGIYYGSAIIPTKLDSVFVRGLNKSLQKDQVKTFSIDSGVNQYVWYAIPSRYGEPVFNVGGFDGGFTKISEISFENSSGYTEKYAVYRSDNSNLGKKTIKVT